MSRKKEYEEVLNKVFGTNVRWSKLSLEELIQISTVLTTPEVICRRICGEDEISKTTTMLIKSLKNILKEVKYEGPLIKSLKKVFGVEGFVEGEEEEEKPSSSK